MIFCLGIMGIGLVSCGKNCGSLGWALAIQDEANALSTASSAYSQDQSPANCEAYRQAYLDYIHALRDYDNCVEGGDRASWQQSLNEAEDDLDDLQC